MNRAVTYTAMATLAMLMTACGSSTQATTNMPAASPAAPSSSPTYLENATCRTEAKPLFDIYDSMPREGDTLDALVFDDKLESMQEKASQALEACSTDLVDGVQRGLDELEKVRETINGCEGSGCDGKIVTKLMAAYSTMDAARGSLTAQG